MTKLIHRRLTRTLLLAAFLTIGYSALAQVTAPDFSVVVLPDPQNYSQSRPDIFNAQTQWIVNNRAKYNIPFVLGEGDMVNVADQPAQWQNADAAIRLSNPASITSGTALSGTQLNATANVPGSFVYSPQRRNRLQCSDLTRCHSLLAGKQ